jgi:hypothetical protein
LYQVISKLSRAGWPWALLNPVIKPTLGYPEHFSHTDKDIYLLKNILNGEKEYRCIENDSFAPYVIY